MSDNKINLSTALPLSEWKTRDGRKAVFGCWNKDNLTAIGWVNEIACLWQPNGRNSFESYDIITPWPKEPVCFEAGYVYAPSTTADKRASIYADELVPFIGKRVKVIVGELP